jgi:hypothetical protein
MARPLLVLLALGLLAAPAQAATGRGTFELRRGSSAAWPAARADWTVGGSVVGARAEAPKVGLPADRLLRDTDLRYVHASLTAAHVARETTDCGDGTGGTTTQSFDGVASASAAFQTELVLDQLHGRGSAQLAVADSPWPGSEDRAFAPGRTRYTMHSTCYGQTQDSSAEADVVGDGPPTFFGMFGPRRLYEHAWVLRRGHDGAWRMSGTHRWSDAEQRLAVTANVAFRGSGRALHARCVIPRIRDLAPARSAAAAKRIMRRAGFPRVTLGTRHTRAARRGRWFVVAGYEELGGQAALCDGSRLRLVRSLGWP